MLFTSIIFLYYFLPILLLIYFISKNSIKNYVLLSASLLFYAWGEPKFVFLMVIMIIMNYFIGLAIDKEKTKNDWIENLNIQPKKDYSNVYLIFGIVLNLSVLGYFKYSMFFIENFNNIFNTSITINTIKLPIGISFFTFQAMSYIIDVYRNDGKVQKNLANLMLYISLFPQLIAGPIVRYSTVDDQIRERNETASLFASGVNRFIIGLGKKILLSNNMAIIADRAFNAVADGSEVSVAFAWAGIVCYTLQIYFDFSGYSDMAIGLGKMFGFEFLENFNYPYISKSISEFWRRWHISLGSWFRDYVYIPLGGNRCSIGRNVFNLSVVWFLTGFWHGANWTFIMWGVYFGVFIILEKYILKDILTNIPDAIMMIITFFLVVLGWVLFRSESIDLAIEYYGVMFGFGNNVLFNESNFMFFIYEYSPIFIISLIGATPLPKIIVNKVFIDKTNSIYLIFETIFLIGLMYICTASLVATDFNPFIYFNF